MERNMTSAAFAGPPAHPETLLKNLIPVSPSNAICVKIFRKVKNPYVFSGVLMMVYEEKEEEVEESVKAEDLEIGLESLIDKYGKEKIFDTVARMSKKS
jgi:hypothetical protein